MTPLDLDTVFFDQWENRVRYRQFIRHLQKVAPPSVALWYKHHLRAFFGDRPSEPDKPQWVLLDFDTGEVLVLNWTRPQGQDPDGRYVEGTLFDPPAGYGFARYFTDQRQQRDLVALQEACSWNSRVAGSHFPTLGHGELGVDWLKGPKSYARQLLTVEGPGDDIVKGMWASLNYRIASPMITLSAHTTKTQFWQQVKGIHQSAQVMFREAEALRKEFGVTAQYGAQKVSSSRYVWMMFQLTDPQNKTPQGNPLRYSLFATFGGGSENTH